VYKTGVTHYFNISKARMELGYRPSVQNDMDSVVKWYLERGYHRCENHRAANLDSHSSCLLLLLLLLLIFLLLMFACGNVTL